MRKNIAMICVTLAAVIAAQGCINHEIRLDSFEELCIASGGEVENSLQCKCPQSEIVCSVGTVCNNMGECLGIGLDGTSCKDSDNKICSNGVIYDCKFEQEKYVWREFDTCPSGICNETGDACLAICKEGNTKCDYINESGVEFAVITTCIGGRWDYDNSERCSQSVSCTADNKISDDAENIQDDVGGDWKCGECKNDDIKCENDLEYGKSFKCDNGLWEENNICQSNASCTINEGGESACGYCRNGEMKCEVGKEFICQNGQWNEISICSNSASCTKDDEGQSTCGICSDGSFKCMNNTSQLCQNGQWEVFENCTVSCDSKNELCIGCIDGDTLCVNGKIKTCVNSVWGESQECMNSASCQDMKQCGVCQSGDRICKNDKIYICDNGGWGEAIQNCENNVSCTINELGQSVCGYCKNNDTKCENGKSFVCTDGLWKEDYICQDNASCTNDEVGRTVCGYCKNGNTKCENGIVYTCFNGVWEQSQICSGVCDKTGKTCDICNENESICINGENGGIFKLCEAGKWLETSKCSNNASCRDSQNCGICEDGKTKCDSYGFSVCENGQWSSAVPCANGASCKNDTECGVCKNSDTAKCFDNVTITKCIGGEWEIIDNCDSNTYCFDGSCLESQCDETYKANCKNDSFNIGSIYSCNEQGMIDVLSCVELGTSNPLSCRNNEKCGVCLNNSIYYQNVYEQDKKKCKKTECINGENKSTIYNDKSCLCPDGSDGPCTDIGDCLDGEISYKMDENNYCVELICKNGKKEIVENHEVSCKSDLNGKLTLGNCYSNGKVIDVSTSSTSCTLQRCVNGTKYEESKSNVSCSIGADGNAKFGECITDSRKCEYGPNGEAYSVLCKNGIWGTPVKCASYCSDQDHKCH